MEGRSVRFAAATIVITGVGHEGQVGEAVAQAFAAEGATLVLLDRTADIVGARAAALTASGARATGYACDLTDPAEVAAVAARVATATPQIDALVNVAGGFAMSGPLGTADVATLRGQIDVNLTTAWVASNAFVPLIKDGGSVVYFTSASVLPGARSANMSAYAAAKSGVVGLMHAMADEGRSRGIRSNAVAPVVVRTAANLRDMGTNVRFVEREVVAQTVLFLCSADARAITDQIIRLSD
jgi:NAD(P)-dependent dehydrogenase (short-subunit alcohol dehydrogenase family)